MVIRETPGSEAMRIILFWCFPAHEIPSVRSGAKKALSKARMAKLPFGPCPAVRPIKVSPEPAEPSPHQSWCRRIYSIAASPVGEIDDQRLNLLPFAAGQSATDARHEDTRAQLMGGKAQFSKHSQSAPP